MMTIFNKTTAELQELLHKKEVSVKELTEATYDRIAKTDDDVQAFIID